MDSSIEILNDLISNDTYKTLPPFLDRLDFLIAHVSGGQSRKLDFTEFLDDDFIREISIFSQPNISLYFGKSFKELKCEIVDKYKRIHEMCFQYMGPKKFRILDVNLPYSHIQDREYQSLQEVINVFIKNVDRLHKYFEQMDHLNSCEAVMEPVTQIYKENKRKIQLAPRIWLQVEVSADGSANDLHVTGQDGQKYQKLNEMLLSWDHDSDIATNVLNIIDSLKSIHPLIECTPREETKEADDVPLCRICYCLQLPGDRSMPQSLCNNPNCGIYLHRGCLYEWLVACDGGRPPVFGVAIGTCPNCMQYIQCNETDI